MSTLEELKRRKIVQWALAYLAGAWVVVEVADHLADVWGLPELLIRGLHVVLAVGLVVTLILAWYHGEQGRQRVSGPELLMVAALLVVAGAAVTGIARSANAPEQGTGEPGSASVGAGAELPPLPAAGDSIPMRSIAVLPLDNYSPGGENAYFAAAMTEEITNALMNVPELRVSPRNSAAKFAASDLTVGEFVRGKLKVAHALEGSVQLQGNRARIVVQLIDAASEEHIWSEDYAVELIDVIDVQVDIAREVADRLASTFSDRDEERIRAGSTNDPVAYDLYLQARAEWLESTGEQNRVIDPLNQAIARDSGFTLAYITLAGEYYARATFTQDGTFIDSMRTVLDRGIATATDSSLIALMDSYRIIYTEEDFTSAIANLRGLARDYPSRADYALLLGGLYANNGDLSEALSWGRRAVALDPLDPGHRFLTGWIYWTLGFDSAAVEEFETIRQLGDPTPWASWLLLELHLLRRDYGKAMAIADSFRANDRPESRMMTVMAHLWAGDLEAAQAAARDVGDSALAYQGWKSAPMVAHVLLLAGDTARAETLLARAEDVPAAPRDVRAGPLLRAQIAAVRGDAEAAAQWLRHATRLGAREARSLRANPVFGRVRGDPGFEAAVVEQERLVARERREAMPLLDRGPGSND